MKLIYIILFLSLPFIANGQSLSSRGLDPAVETRVQEKLKSLESDNTVRLALERGERGSGIHYAWMDEFGRHVAMGKVKLNE